jgi:hypothetical protein
MPCAALVVDLKVFVMSIWTNINWRFLVFHEPGSTEWKSASERERERSRWMFTAKREKEES